SRALPVKYQSRSLPVRYQSRALPVKMSSIVLQLLPSVSHIVFVFIFCAAPSKVIHVVQLLSINTNFCKYCIALLLKLVETFTVAANTVIAENSIPAKNIVNNLMFKFFIPLCFSFEQKFCCLLIFVVYT
ncbi:MAG TPA: hypothetical protein PL124_12035, partial [Candidatus Cloacimonadota bacterium]|nr:hypothetical protein [Candidatus Cloacimonadota bacterium]